MAQLQWSDIDHRHVTDADQASSLVAIDGADVDVEILDLGYLLAIVFLEQMDRLSPDHAGHRTVAGGDAHALADQHHRVPATDLTEAQEPAVVDVGNVNADLVDVTDHRQRGSARGPATRA